MIEQSYRDRYFELLRAYVESPDEELLMASAELGRELESEAIPIENIVEMHIEAEKHFKQSQDLSWSVIQDMSVLQMEMLMAYSTAYRSLGVQLQRSSIARRVVGQMLSYVVSVSGIPDSAVHIAGQKFAAEIMSVKLSDSLDTFAALGLGTLEVAEVDQEKRRWTFFGYDLLEVNNRNERHPTCNYVRGFLNGTIQQVSGSDKVSDIETACQSMGNAACCFVVQALD